jgi:hypothetical protein
LDAYEYYYDNIEYISMMGCCGYEDISARYKKTRFTCLGGVQSGVACRYIKSMLSRYPALVYDIMSNNMISRVRKSISCVYGRVRPNIVIFETLAAAAIMSRVGNVFDGCVKVMRSMDIVNRGYRQYANNCMYPLRLAWEHEIRRMERLERYVIDNVDEVWAISDVEARLYSCEYGARCGGVLGVYVNTDKYSDVVRGDSECVICVGSIDTKKRHGVERFIGISWPVVRGIIPGAKMVLAGKGTEVYDNPVNGIVGLGYVDDEKAVLSRGGIFVNPQISGSGVKIKSINAMAAKRTLVSTYNGVEGIRGVAGRDYIVCGDGYEMGVAVAGLMKDSLYAEKVACSGYDMVEREYGKGIFLERSKFIYDNMKELRGFG